MQDRRREFHECVDDVPRGFDDVRLDEHEEEVMYCGSHLSDAECSLRQLQVKRNDMIQNIIFASKWQKGAWKRDADIDNLYQEYFSEKKGRKKQHV